MYLKLLQREVFDLQKGAAQPHVYISDIENFKIPNIPISKQKELLEEYKVIEQTENELTKSIDDYHNQINELIKDSYNSTSKVQLGKICTSAQYGLSLSMNTAGKGYRIFRMNEVINGLMVDTGKMKYENIDGTEFAKYKLNKGDILFNRTNSFNLVGKTGIFDLEGDYCYASYLIRVVVDNTKANPWFVNLMMNSDAFQREAKGKAARSVSQANINAQKMQSISIPLPGLTEQDQLAKSAKDLQIKITDAQAQLSLLPEQKENLLRKYINVNEIIQSPKIAVVKTGKKTATTPNLVVDGKAKEKTASKGKAIKKTGKSKSKK